MIFRQLFNWHHFFLLMAFFLIFSCQKESRITEAYVDDELSQLFDQFVQEGLQRGVIIDFVKTPVEGFLDSSLGASVTGQCQHDSNNPDRVLINRSYWNRVTELQKEFLVFHELGHCYLQRSHLDDKNDRGECMSIMHSSSSACENAYSLETRASYLDELFNSNR
ncbi:MAG: hypothetical protein HKN76_20170 [Saprospiraceae bacterium]|nr:hypothetical protein [Saprospiraceae bacterium]